METWTGQRPPRRRGAPDLAQVVDAGVRIADAEGLPAVSMRRIATELRSGTASLYRILESREELLDHMVDAVLGSALPPAASGDWRHDLAGVARNRRSLLHCHAWLGGQLAGRPALGPNALRHHESALAATAALTDDPTIAGSVVEVVFAYVLGAVARELAAGEAARRTGRSEEAWRAGVGPYLRRVLDSGEYPHLSRTVREAADLDADARFEWGLARVLDGVAAAGVVRRDAS